MATNINIPRLPRQVLSLGGAAAVQTAILLSRAIVRASGYAVKIRLPHSLVNGVLYNTKNTYWTIIKKSFEAAFEHGRNLALFAAIYKLIIIILRILHNPHLLGLTHNPITTTTSSSSSSTTNNSPIQNLLLTTPSLPWHAAVAGAIGASLVWRKPTPINLQVTFYLLSRVIIAVIRTLASKNIYPFNQFSYNNVLPYITICTWSIVMYLWENPTTRSIMHPSLARSMDDIYLAADQDALSFTQQLFYFFTTNTGSNTSTTEMSTLSSIIGNNVNSTASTIWSTILESFKPSPATAAVLVYALLSGLSFSPT